MTQSPYEGEPPLTELAGVRPSVSQLEAVVAVVDYGSFTAAADVLMIAQPSLSRRIRTLEQALDARLFVPVGRRMELTDLGERIVTAGRRILRDVSEIEAMVTSDQQVTSGSLRIAGLPSLVATEVPAKLGEFHRAHPGVRIELFSIEDTPQLIEALRMGRADIGFGVTDQVPHDMDVVPIRTQDFVAVVPTDRDPGRIITSDLLAELTLVTLPRGTSIREIAESVYRAHGVRPPRVLTTTQRDALVELGIASGGITIVPDALARTAGLFGGRAVGFIDPVQRQIGALHRSDRHQPHALRSFLSTLDIACRLDR